MAIAPLFGTLIFETRTTGVGWWAIFDTIVVIPIQVSFRIVIPSSQTSIEHLSSDLQAFYAGRAFRLMSNNYWVLAAIIAGMCCQFSASIAVAVITAVTPGFDQIEVSRNVGPALIMQC
jgi:hypothetical protein